MTEVVFAKIHHKPNQLWMDVKDDTNGFVNYATENDIASLISSLINELINAMWL